LRGYGKCGEYGKSPRGPSSSAGIRALPVGESCADEADPRGCRRPGRSPADRPRGRLARRPGPRGTVTLHSGDADRILEAVI
jgi:hypothetical protein